MAAKRLIFIDMDGTIVYGTYTGAFLCRLNSVSEQDVRQTELRERRERLSWAGGDMLRAPLMKGLSVQKVRERIGELSMIDGLGEFMRDIKSMGFVTVLASAGPAVAAALLAEKWGFDRWFASEYEVTGGVMTGAVTRFVTPEGKAENVRSLCAQYGAAPEMCAAIGDGATDVEMLPAVGCSIALNASPALEALAMHRIRTRDIRDALPVLRAFAAQK